MAGGAQSGTGRWHVRLVSPDNVVIFEDVIATGESDAFAQAAALHPDHRLEWAIREPNRYGVFANGMPF